MKKKVLILAAVVVIAVIVAGVILFLDRGEELPTAQDQTREERVNISRLPNGWQLIENTKFHYTFEIPPNWEPQLIGDDIEAGFRTDTFRADVLINGYSNPENIDLIKWVESSKPNEISEVIKGGIKGLRYVGRELVEGYEDGEIQLATINESYILGNIFQIQDKVVDIRCSISGSNYRTMIPTCEEIIGSLQFIE